MNYETFLESLSQHEPPAGLAAPLKALWFDARNDWSRSHEIAQDINDHTGSWIHAYLHRKEGDQSNAGYWYRKAGKPIPVCSLTTEFEQMLRELLSETSNS